MNIILEALTFYKERKTFNPSKLINMQKYVVLKIS